MQQLASSQTTAATPTLRDETQPPPPPPQADQLDLVGPAPFQNASAAAASQPAKLRPVNFTLVNELFETVLDDDEVAARWRKMDSQFQEGIRSILKLVFPQIVAVSQDAKVSGDCSGGILKWILSLRNMRSWALKSKRLPSLESKFSLAKTNTLRSARTKRAPSARRDRQANRRNL